MNFLEFVLSGLAPHECVGCKKEGRLLCAACLDGLPPLPSRCYRCNRATKDFRTCPTCRKQSRLTQVWAVTPYTGPAKLLIRKLKFERARAGALDVALAISRQLPDGQAWVITAVPTATSRVRLRGYDQAQLIAREIARLRGCAYAPLLGRLGQLKGLFRPRQHLVLQNRHVLLIDDVLTTGASIEAAADTLRTAGAQRVSAAVFAAA
jgi:predicted amidophosphoribosyltransferase